MGTKISQGNSAVYCGRAHDVVRLWVGIFVGERRIIAADRDRNARAVIIYDSVSIYLSSWMHTTVHYLGSAFRTQKRSSTGDVGYERVYRRGKCCQRILLVDG